MSHMVTFATADGKPAYHPTDSLDEAVRFVERLRNQESVDDVKILAVREIAFEFKSYFKVELGESASLEAEELAALAADGVDDPEPQPEPEPVGASSGNSKRRFGK